jgi:hypothetical protein
VSSARPPPAAARQAFPAVRPGALVYLRLLVAGPGHTHEGSDVDLMVSGLPSGERTNAWLKLEELFEAPVDLVPEEVASRGFRAAVRRRGQEITALGGDPVAQ